MLSLVEFEKAKNVLRGIEKVAREIIDHYHLKRENGKSSKTKSKFQDLCSRIASKEELVLQFLNIRRAAKMVQL